MSNDPSSDLPTVLGAMISEELGDEVDHVL